jgi:hypothetical protein
LDETSAPPLDVAILRSTTGGAKCRPDVASAMACRGSDDSAQSIDDAVEFGNSAVTIRVMAIGDMRLSRRWVPCLPQRLQRTGGLLWQAAHSQAGFRRNA